MQSHRPEYYGRNKITNDGIMLLQLMYVNIQPAALQGIRMQLPVLLMGIFDGPVRRRKVFFGRLLKTSCQVYDSAIVVP